MKLATEITEFTDTKVSSCLRGKKQAIQRLLLEAKRRPRPQLRAYKLVVAYFDTETFKGWHSFLQTYDRRGPVWIDGHKRELIESIMSVFPIVIPPLFGARQAILWEEWKMEFSKRFCRRQQNGKPVGVCYVWWDRDERFTTEPQRPRKIK